MNATDIIAAAAAVSVPLASDQAAALLALGNMLVDWNARFNLTALTDDASIVSLHFADSLTAVPVIRALGLPAHARLIDVGTGGGFPGFPIKIAMPDVWTTLMDATAKKVQFCDEVIRALKLDGIRAVQGRAEEAAHQPGHREHYDVVIARAVAPMPTLVEYLLPLARVGGYVVAMKGSDARAEVDAARGAIAQLGGELTQIDDATLPGRDDKRSLVVIHKTHATQKLYPRQGGAPRKNPLR